MGSPYRVKIGYNEILRKIIDSPILKTFPF